MGETIGAKPSGQIHSATSRARLIVGVMRNASVQVPEPVADALRGEAARRGCRPGEVLADFVRACWPRFVAGALEKDLRPVVDAELVDDRSSEPADRPALPREEAP